MQFAIWVYELENNFLHLLKTKNEKKQQPEYFQVSVLKELFYSKIVLSQVSGKDGVRGARFKDVVDSECKLISSRVLGGNYSFTTYKERLLTRGSGRSPRQISIPTIRDRLALRSLCELIHSHVNNSTNTTPHTLINEIISRVRHLDTSFSYIRIDVKDFYPSIKHNILENELRVVGLEDFVINLCMKAVQTPTGDKETPTSRGIPQGLSVSNALAQIYMKRFDELRKKEGLVYFRYVDDILCIAPSVQAEQILKRIVRGLNRNGLMAHPIGSSGKTEIKSVSEGVEFLGYSIKTDRISVRKSSYDKMFRNLNKVITEYKYGKNLERLIYRINLKITGCIFGDKRRGWMMFFSRTENISQLRYLDNFVIKQLNKNEFPKDRIYQIRSFVKSYYEIRFNMEKTNYIPNFNEYSESQKIDAISILTRNNKNEISTWNIQYIDETFNKVISREVMDLEQDVGGVS